MSPLPADRPEWFRRVSALTCLGLLMRLGYVRREKAFVFKSGRWRNFSSRNLHPRLAPSPPEHERLLSLGLKVDCEG